MKALQTTAVMIYLLFCVLLIRCHIECMHVHSTGEDVAKHVHVYVWFSNLFECMYLMILFLFFVTFIDVVLPEKRKLKFLNKVPNFKTPKKEMKRLRDIQGPAKRANTFTTGQYAIVVSAFIFCRLCSLEISEALQSTKI